MRASSATGERYLYDGASYPSALLLGMLVVEIHQGLG